MKKCLLLLLQRWSSAGSCERVEASADKVKKIAQNLSKRRKQFASKSFQASKHNSTWLQVTGPARGGNSSGGWWEGGEVGADGEQQGGDGQEQEQGGGGLEQEQGLDKLVANVKETKSEAKAEDWSCQENAGEH